MPAPPPMTAGVTQQGSSVDRLVWNILGQTYTPLHVTESSFSWHGLFPPGTFVPPHVHPTQDEFIYVFDGKFDLVLDGQPATATNGDLIRLPRGIPHGIFNNGQANVTCLFWVAPTRRLWDLFLAINNVPDPAEVIRLAELHEVNFLPPSMHSRARSLPVPRTRPLHRHR
jgi:mannose-6-phosphate isomerase-like protein (cupin superfamily)